ncbi:MAG: hypothetical protein RL302_377 [Pseudomonadota bacterium]|jgi:hypothetical protein
MAADNAAMTVSFAPPAIAQAQDLVPALQTQGYAVVAADLVSHLCAAPLAAFDAWLPTWADLPADGYLRDGGRYRRRRHACFVVQGDQATLAPHRPHWQPLEYNALHGGMQRHFEPMLGAVVADPHWTKLLVWLGDVCSALRGTQTWYAEAHQFRIDTTDGIGRPTPEGAHRDGVDLVAVFLVDRNGIKGGETRVFDAAGPSGQRFTLTEPWSLLLLDDMRVVHESTPIQPLTEGGHRDTLVITLRANGFQGQ